MSSGFVTEKEAAEARQRRQEEWEKVRTPDQPLDRPEEPYDGRSLYDRLKEQKDKKDMEFEESQKFKNLIRGLDDEEVTFLELVGQNKLDAERKTMQEDRQELEDFRNRVAILQEESVEKKIQLELKQHKGKESPLANVSARPSQRELLGLGIKRKNGERSGTSIISCSEVAEAPVIKNEKQSFSSTKEAASPGQETKQLIIHTNAFDKGNFKCTAILPGIGCYTDSTDSEMSSGSEEEPQGNGCKYDLVGRKRQRKKQCSEE